MATDRRWWYMFRRGFIDSLPNAYAIGQAAYFIGTLMLWTAGFSAAVIGCAVMVADY